MYQSDLDIFLNANTPDYYRQLEMLMFKHPGKYHVDLLDGGDHYDLVAEFPGIPRENIQLDISGDVLTLRAEYAGQEEHDTHDYLQRERHDAKSGAYIRQFNISKVDAEKIKAHYNHGLLKVVLPKKPGADSADKKITIE